MIETFQVESMNGIIDFVRIVSGDTATIMTQENYDKQQAAQVEHLTEIVPADE
jgi:flagellar biosynthesis GTPase FlhF